MYKLTIKNVLDFAEYWARQKRNQHQKPTERDFLKYFGLLHDEPKATSKTKTKRNHP